MKTFPETLDQRLDAIHALPTLPSVALEVERAIRDENTGAADVARIIEGDPSLAGKLLQVANSVYFGARSGEISSIPLAVARLGMLETGKLLTTLAVIKTFEGVGANFDHQRFWKHCLTAAIATRIISIFSERKRYFSTDDAYVAGLLHDIGALLLNQFFPEEFAATHAHAAEKQCSLADAEQALLGLDHGAIGGRLLERWRLPESIVAAVTHHHAPGDAPQTFRPIAQAIHLADAVCTILGIGDGGDGHIETFSAGAWHDLELSSEDIPAITEKLTAEAAHCEALIRLSRGS